MRGLVGDQADETLSLFEFFGRRVQRYAQAA
jgi:hypothetical protein